MQTVTQAAQDIGFGTRVVAASNRTRIVTALGTYSGTNTAAASIGYFLLPSQPGSGSTSSLYDLSEGAQVGVKLYHMTGNLSAGLAPATGFSMMTDRGGPMFLIIPPYQILVAVVQDNNADGTIVHNINTADLGDY